MDPARLLRLHRAHLRAGDADLLRPRTPLGQRRQARRVSLIGGLLGSAARRTADALLTIVLAPACASCGDLLERPTDGPVCDVCWRAIFPLTPPLCDRCGDPLLAWGPMPAAELICSNCRETRGHVDRARAIGPYDGSLRAILHALKYEGRRSLARPLAALMRARGRDMLSGADWLVPVPLHPSRRRERGFNQAADLAGHLGLPVCHALSRVRQTQTQTELPAAARHQNVSGAFALAPRARARVPQRVIVLVDDVSTTGATLDACARVLKEAGAKEVRALTAARVVSPRR